jgi:hypothetical protein
MTMPRYSFHLTTARYSMRVPSRRSLAAPGRFGDKNAAVRRWHLRPAAGTLAGENQARVGIRPHLGLLGHAAGLHGNRWGRGAGQH